MTAIEYKKITQEESGQRIDNFLIRIFKGVPKSRIYKAVRQGEVRVNKKRVQADYRLIVDDLVRLPPFRVGEAVDKTLPNSRLIKLLEDSIILENEAVIIINKPIGIAAHGGSEIPYGAVELLRLAKPHIASLDLVHRIDRATSGCMILAKSRNILNEINQQIKQKTMKKRYLALIRGKLDAKIHEITEPLQKFQVKSGERMVTVSSEGLSSHTKVKVIKYFKQATLVEAEPVTGRTHQLRVHFAHIGHPIAGDEKYGDKVFNKEMKKFGLNRMFLHAAEVEFKVNSLDKNINVCACLDSNLYKTLRGL